MSDVRTPHDKDDVIASTTTTIDQLRERIDSLRVQADLAKLDARDAAEKQLDIAQNACLAAYAKLREAGHDLALTTDALRDSMKKLVHDLQEAVDAAAAVISRG